MARPLAMERDGQTTSGSGRYASIRSVGMLSVRFRHFLTGPHPVVSYSATSAHDKITIDPFADWKVVLAYLLEAIRHTQSSRFQIVTSPATTRRHRRLSAVQGRPLTTYPDHAVASSVGEPGARVPPELSCAADRPRVLRPCIITSTYALSGSLRSVQGLVGPQPQFGTARTPPIRNCSVNI
jgi:hypothetical protein